FGLYCCNGKAAEVGMAIGAGTDIAIEAPDIALKKSNLKDVLTAIDLSWKIFSRIRLNYMWALTSSVSQLLLGPSSPAQGSGCHHGSLGLLRPPPQ
ncbi:hypothetical protein CRG98_049792, partial [Punica granatum]